MPFHSDDSLWGVPANGAPSFESLFIGRQLIKGIRVCPLRDWQNKPLQEATNPLNESERLQEQRGTRKDTFLA